MIHEDLYDAEDTDDDPGLDSAKASALEAEVEAIDAKLETLRHDLSEWSADILAFAGVVVALDRNGEVIVHRGMVKPEDRKQAAKVAAARAWAPRPDLTGQSWPLSAHQRMPSGLPNTTEGRP